VSQKIKKFERVLQFWAEELFHCVNLVQSGNDGHLDTFVSNNGAADDAIDAARAEGLRRVRWFAGFKRLWGDSAS
jgi:hypothetical protein